LTVLKKHTYEDPLPFILFDEHGGWEGVQTKNVTRDWSHGLETVSKCLEKEEGRSSQVQIHGAEGGLMIKVEAFFTTDLVTFW